jgi:rod shape-determining protein MreD
MRRWTVILMLLSCAVLGDAGLGVLWPATTRPPVLTFAVVAGVALFGGGRLGVVAGFGAGVVLDLLSGSASLAGVHTLAALITGSAVGYVRRRRRHVPAGFAAATGGLAVSAAAVAAVVLHRMLGYTVGGIVGDVVGQALVAGAVATPLAWRALDRLSVRPLSDVPSDV